MAAPQLIWEVVKVRGARFACRPTVLLLSSNPRTTDWQLLLCFPGRQQAGLEDAQWFQAESLALAWAGGSRDHCNPGCCRRPLSFLCCAPLLVLVLDAPLQGHNAFIRKNLNHTTFSAEPGNLYNKHSYKHSGACLWQQHSNGSSTRAVGDATSATWSSELGGACGRTLQRSWT